MPPRQGDTHRAPRSDSGVVRLWIWARRKKLAWTADEAAEGAKMSRSRCRATVKALKDAGLVIEVDARESLGHRDGWSAPTYRLAPHAEGIDTRPIMTMRNGQIVGVRFSSGSEK